MKWFRMWDEIIDDPKMMSLTDFQFRMMVSLMSVANQSKIRGSLLQSHLELSWRLRVRKNDLSKAIQKLIDLGILITENNTLRFANWDKRQFKSDDVYERVKRFRNVSETVSETAPDTDTDTDKERDTNVSLVGQPADEKPKHPNCPHQEIVTAYNETLGHLLSPARYSLWPNSAGAANLQARWKENEKRQRIEFWTGLFEYIRDECPFLIGQGGSNGGKPWRADLRWIVKRENLIKIQEGRYAKQ